MKNPRLSEEKLHQFKISNITRKAKEKGEKLTINMDGGYGYPTSFLEEAFGGLARKYDPNEVLQMLIFIFGIS